MILKFEDFLNEGSNLPAGAAHDPRAPWNQKSTSPRKKKSRNKGLKLVARGEEVFWFQSRDKNLWELYLPTLDDDDVKEIAIDFDGNYTEVEDWDDDAGAIAGYETDASYTDLSDDAILAWLNDNWPVKDAVKLNREDAEETLDTIAKYDKTSGARDFSRINLNKWKNTKQR
jgi:hypothetical protein